MKKLCQRKVFGCISPQEHGSLPSHLIPLLLHRALWWGGDSPLYLPLSRERLAEVVAGTQSEKAASQKNTAPSHLSLWASFTSSRDFIPQPRDWGGGGAHGGVRHCRLRVRMAGSWDRAGIQTMVVALACPRHGCASLGSAVPD